MNPAKIIVCFILLWLPNALVWSQKVKPLEDGTILEWQTQLQAGGEIGYSLVIRTKEVYDCQNYSLPFTTKLTGDKWVVTVKGVAEPADCDAGLAPAKAEVSMANMAPGTYDAKIWVNRQDFAGTLSISEQGVIYRLDPSVDKSLMKMPSPELKWVPRAHVWGTIEYAKPELKVEVAHILEDFAKEGAIKAQLATGNYGFFYFHESGEIPARKMEKGWEAQPFVCAYRGDVERLNLIRKMYLDKFGTDLKVNLFHR